MSDQSASDINFATEEQIADTIAGNSIVSAMVDALFEVTDTDEITHEGLSFAKAVATMVGLDFQDDPETVISDLRRIPQW